MEPDDEFLQGLHFVSLAAAAAAAANNSNAADAPATTAACDSVVPTAANVKTLTEHHMLESYERLLAALGDADRRFLAVADGVSKLAAEGNRANAVLQQCAAASGSLLGRVDGLVAELAEVQQREQRISSFIRAFQISDSDGLVLRKGEITAEFVEVLSRLQLIHDTCKSHAASSSVEQQQAAVEVMESTFLLHMSCLEKVTLFVCNTAPEICGGEAAALDHATLFVNAVRALQSNPGMWAKAVHEIARVRRVAVLRRLATHTAQIIREASVRHAQQQQQQQHRGGGSAQQQQTAAAANNSAAGGSVALRLVGDLCAWLDESAVEERESASAFFRPSASNTAAMRRMGSSSSSSSFVDERQGSVDGSGGGGGGGGFSAATSSTAPHLTLADYLDSVFDAAARQLKQRALETISEMSEDVWPRHGHGHGAGSSSSSSALMAASSSSGSSASISGASAAVAAAAGGAVAILEDPAKLHALVALFKTESLLGFYGSRVAGVFGKSSAVVAALNDVRLESMRLFFEMLQGVSGAVRAVTSEGTHDLSPQPCAMSACSLLRSLLQVIEQSPTPQAQRGVDAAPLLGAILGPIMAALETLTTSSANAAAGTAASGGGANSSADAHSNNNNNNTCSTIVYSINTLCVALAAVLPFEFASAKQQALTDMLEAAVARYIAVATDRTVERLELGVARQLISQMPRPTRESAALAMKVFFAGVFAGEGFCPLPVPNLESVQPVRVRERCRKEVVKAVRAMYDEIYAIVARDIETDADARKMIMHHTPEQLQMLLE